ncbi:MAG: hypothetical protein HC771_04195 [Synechococcales cyanobacterium CRU_2_2]|nr:hypothetical protein [Synechococcales cyanobacterium CRU_2_2]
MRHFSHLPVLNAVLSVLISSGAALAIAPVVIAQTATTSTISRESFQRGAGQLQAQLQEFDFQDSQLEQLRQPNAPANLPGAAPAPALDGNSAPDNVVPNNITPGIAPNRAFYDEARRLTQDQINIASRARRAMTAVDPNAIRAVDGQIVLHGTRVNRFLAENYPVARPNCAQAGSMPSIAAQDLVACNLLKNSQAFDQLQPRLFSRLNMLSGIAEVNALPLVSGERAVSTGGVPLFERGSFKNPSPTIVTRAPDLPRKEVGVLGRPVKSALGDYRAPISPAIAAPDDVVRALDAIEVRLDEMRSVLPVSAQAFGTGRRSVALSPVLTRPETLIAAADAAAYDVQPTERLQHQKFLTNPHTGITQVLTRREHQPDPNLLRNRLEPTPAERYPYAILVEPTDPPLPKLDGALQGRLAPFDTQRYPFVPLEETSFRPRLAMQIDSGEFNLIASGLDYGFMLDLGQMNNLDLNQLSAGLPKSQLNLREDLREFFLSYRAPQNLDQLLVDRRRFLSGKMGPNNLPSLLSPEAKVQVGHTYLLRTLQFQVPDAIAKGTPVSYAQRRNLEKTLEMPAKDLLVVFQPVKSRENGTYTVLWRVLGEFPEPYVTDLNRYANYEGGIIGQGIPGIRR